APVDANDHVAAGGEELPVPAIGPGISEGGLRAAVHEEFDGVFLGWVEVGRLDEEALDFGAVRAGEPEGFEWGHLYGVAQSAIEVSEPMRFHSRGRRLRYRSAGRSEGHSERPRRVVDLERLHVSDFSRSVDSYQRTNETGATFLYLTPLASCFAESTEIVSIDTDLEERLLTAIRTGEIEILGVLTPSELVYPIFERRSSEKRQMRWHRLFHEDVHPAAGAIHDRKSELIRLITIPRLRTPREPLAVGRVLRAVVAARRGGDLYSFCVGVVELEGEDVVVGGLAGLREDTRLGESDLEVGDVGDLARVGSPGVAERAAEG